MGVVSGGGAQFNGGTITAPLVDAVAGDSTLRFPDGSAELSVTAAVGSSNNGRITAYNETFSRFAQINTGTGLNVESDAANPLVTVADGAARYIVAGVTTGLLFGGVHAAPADAAIHAGECALWLDQTNGACNLMVKAKQADGTVRTAAIALT